MNQRFFLLLLLVLTTARKPDIGIGDYQQDKVLIQLFYEAECPACKRFMTNQLAELIQVPGIFEITNFRLYPFGNGKIYRNNKDITFTCQHGQSQCQGNIVATCALDLYPQVQSIPFAICLDNPSNSWRQIGQQCAQLYNLDWSIIEDCTNSDLGNQAQYAAALATKAAKITSVPTVFADGIKESNFDFKLRDNLLQYICNSYKGKPTIDACYEF